MTRRILITSALPYINGVKHLGNLVGSLLPADVYARFRRSQGCEVLFICATDEHGTPAEIAAADAGQDVVTYCREQHRLQAATYDGFSLSFDYFGRSSARQNHELTQHMFSALEEHGLIEEREIFQIYSSDDNRFLPDRYVIGTCPKCGYERARGDQCENCTSLLDPVDLQNPRSAISGSTSLQVKSSRHLYLKLSTLAPEVALWLNSKTDWPRLVSSIARKWLTEGLHDRCITRDLTWGVPVNREGFEGKVFYVWFDAPIAYLAATKEWADQAPDRRDWKSWWWGADDVDYVQFMAKDNIPFHTVSFPATLIGTREPWKLVDFLKGFNWLNFYGGKFSTSAKRGVFLDDALKELPADYWRYWLLANAPETSDATFSFESLVETVNSDLSDKFGNFCLRVTKLSSSKFGGYIPGGGELSQDDYAFIEELNRGTEAYTALLSQFEYRKAIAQLRELWSYGNNYMARTAPWEVEKRDRNRAASILRLALNVINLYCVLAAPVIPETILRLRSQMKFDHLPLEWPTGDLREFLGQLRPHISFAVPDVPFQKLTLDDAARLRTCYGAAATEE